MMVKKKGSNFLTIKNITVAFPLIDQCHIFIIVFLRVIKWVWDIRDLIASESTMPIYLNTQLTKIRLGNTLWANTYLTSSWVIKILYRWVGNSKFTFNQIGIMIRHNPDDIISPDCPQNINELGPKFQKQQFLILSLARWSVCWLHPELLVVLWTRGRWVRLATFSDKRKKGYRKDFYTVISSICLLPLATFSEKR